MLKNKYAQKNNDEKANMLFGDKIDDLVKFVDLGLQTAYLQNLPHGFSEVGSPELISDFTEAQREVMKYLDELLKAAENLVKYLPPPKDTPEFDDVLERYPWLNQSDHFYGAVERVVGVGVSSDRESVSDPHQTWESVIQAIHLLAPIRRASGVGRPEAGPELKNLVRAVCYYRDECGLPVTFSWGTAKDGPTYDTAHLIQIVADAFEVSYTSSLVKTHLERLRKELKILGKEKRKGKRYFTDQSDFNAFMP